ncbi:hypothetical protein C4K27_0195 [Pseudomonas chlororaphis subsp. chlororaphis]|nr:hypothetical protein C4K27_0195 [Pseudomonas chlororaphis subsp. chlororaphis]
MHGCRGERLGVVVSGQDHIGARGLARRGHGGLRLYRLRGGQGSAPGLRRGRAATGHGQQQPGGAPLNGGAKEIRRKEHGG